MAIYKWVRDVVDSMSYVTRTEFKKAIFTIYYDKDGVEEFKSIPFRANRDQLVLVLENIKSEINLKEFKREEYRKKTKPMMVHVPWKNAGETDGKTNEDSSNTNS